MKARYGASVILSFFFVLLQACGSGDAADNNVPSYYLSNIPSLGESLSAFDEILPMIDEDLSVSCDCDETVVTCVCPCPGGGDVDVRATQDIYWYSMQFTDCTSASGLMFAGTVTGLIDETLDSSGLDNAQNKRTITYDLASFGSCTDVFGTVVVLLNDAEGTDECSGTIHATCNSEAVSCDVSADCSTCN